MKSRVKVLVDMGWMRMFRAILVMKSAPLESGGGPVLVLAPHPDDETLGCGITILSARAEGRAVHVVFACDGSGSHASALISPAELSRIRRAEGVAACEVLGVTDGHVHFLQVPDGKLSDNIATAVARVSEIIATVRPSEVFVCSAYDAHPDHRALNSVARHVSDAADAMAFRLLEYPVWIWSLDCWKHPQARYPRALAEVFRRQLAALRGVRVWYRPAAGLNARKRAALDCHHTQMGTFAEGRGWAALDARFLANFFRDREFLFERKRGAR